jgi:hypothetical protein
MRHLESLERPTHLIANLLRIKLPSSLRCSDGVLYSDFWHFSRFWRGDWRGRYRALVHTFLDYNSEHPWDLGWKKVRHGSPFSL